MIYLFIDGNLDYLFTDEKEFFNKKGIEFYTMKISVVILVLPLVL